MTVRVSLNDRLFWPALYAGILASWALLFAMQLDRAALIGLPAEIWRELCLSADEGRFGALWGMWLAMAAAMMLPSALPAIRTYSDLPGGAGQARGRLVAGYLAVWAGAALIGAAAQAWLATHALVSPLGRSLSPALTTVLLIGAGAYQLSPFKAACLRQCRQPLTFFLAHWAPGPAAALRMGLRLGVVCLGCCWALMALGFVGGTMNLLWMGAATLFMTLEKLPAVGRRLTGPSGVVLLGLGAGQGIMLLGG